MNSTRVAVLAGAAGCYGFFLRVAYRGENAMPVLVLIGFTVWVLSPFVVLLLADRASGRWTALTRATLHRLMLIITVASLAIYGYVALTPPRPKPAFPFVAVPPVSWLLIVISLAIAAKLSDRGAAR